MSNERPVISVTHWRSGPEDMWHEWPPPADLPPGEYEGKVEVVDTSGWRHLKPGEADISPEAQYGDIAWNGQRLWLEVRNTGPSWLVGEAWGELCQAVAKARRVESAEAEAQDLRRKNAELRQENHRFVLSEAELSDELEAVGKDADRLRRSNAVIAAERDRLRDHVREYPLPVHWRQAIDEAVKVHSATRPLVRERIVEYAGDFAERLRARDNVPKETT